MSQNVIYLLCFLTSTSIFRVCVREDKENGVWFDAGFQLNDPEENLCSQSKK